MCEAVRSFFHRRVERLKAYLKGRRGTISALSHNTEAMKVSWLTMENESGELVVEWDRVIRVEAFKRDLFAVDQICLAFILANHMQTEINEEMSGWNSLVEKLPDYLPGCQKFAEWFQVVAFPAFEPNLTVVYRRDIR